MKRGLLGVAGALLIALAAFASYVVIDGIPSYPIDNPEPDWKAESTPARVARGKIFVASLCADCHFNAETNALSGNLAGAIPAEFGVISIPNITQHPTDGIAAWKDAEIRYLLRTGILRTGRYAPPWMAKLPHVSDEDLTSIIAFLRSDDPWVRATPGKKPAPVPSFLSKLLAHLVFKPLPYPSKPIPQPPAEGPELGRYLTWGLDCFTCHSADFKTMNVMDPPKSEGYLAGGNSLEDVTGQTFLTPNITFDNETGIGKWTKEQFVTALSRAVRPDGSVLRVPMLIYNKLSETELGAIYDYLATVPKIVHTVERTPIKVLSKGDGGAVYAKYGCQNCHGATGVGTCDLRGGAAKFSTDDALIAFIKNPQSVVEDARMPRWDGVVKDEDWPLLVRHVRQLGAGEAK